MAPFPNHCPLDKGGADQTLRGGRSPATAHETKEGLTILCRSMLINLLSQGSVLITPPSQDATPKSCQAVGGGADSPKWAVAGLLRPPYRRHFLLSYESGTSGCQYFCFCAFVFVAQPSSSLPSPRGIFGLGLRRCLRHSRRCVVLVAQNCRPVSRGWATASS